MRKIQFGFLVVIFLWLVFFGTALGFYYPPSHVPPANPPNYGPIDSTYFMGTPSLAPPRPDSGGIYIWYSGAMWHIANHIYSKGLSHEQFHCGILVMMDQPPTLGVNVFAENFELSEDTTKPECLKQNDRWGWKPWGGHLYEIWWDVTTRVGKGDEADIDDFLTIIIAGCAVDFNLWSSGKGDAFGPDEIFLGADEIPLSSAPDYYDYFPGIDDPYQSQAGSDPSNTPNITIFTQYSDTLRTYNQLGLIDSTDSYSCELAVDYGQRYAGTFAYEGNGVQFSTQCIFAPNHPPSVQLPPDTSVIVCVFDSYCLDIYASDPDPQDSITLEKVFGQGTFTPVTDTTPISESYCFLPDTSGSYTFIFQVTDKGGLLHSDTTIITVSMSVPPVLNVPADFDTFSCDTTTICFAIGVDDPEDNAVVTVNPPAFYDLSNGLICFPAHQERDYCLEIVATDACGAADTGEVCISVNLSDPPVVSSPDTLVIHQEQAIQCTVTAYDPDGETLDESLHVTVVPDCGEYLIERLTGSGSSSGSWKITFEATDCTVGHYSMAFEIQDSCGNAGSDTTILNIQTRLNNPPAVTVPEADTGFVGDTIKYTAWAFDPDDDVLLDSANIVLFPDCGGTSGTRLTGTGTSSGMWNIMFNSFGCSPGSHQVIVEIEDTLGAIGSGTTYVELKTPSSVDEEDSPEVATFFLKQNYPNPFNLSTEISFQLPRDCKVDLKIYNLKGQVVKTLAQKEMDRGTHTVYWNGTDSRGSVVASGIYFYKLKASNFTSVRKMILLK